MWRVVLTDSHACLGFGLLRPQQIALDPARADDADHPSNGERRRAGIGQGQAEINARDVMRKMLAARAVKPVARLQISTLTAMTFLRLARSAQMPKGIALRVSATVNAPESVPMPSSPKLSSRATTVDAPVRMKRSREWAIYLYLRGGGTGIITIPEQ